MTAIICNDLTVEGDMTVQGKLTLSGDIVPQSGMDVTGDLNSSAGLCTSLFAINALGGVLCKEGCRVVGGYRISKPAQNNTWSVNWVKNNDGSRKLVFIIDQTPIFHVNTVDTKIPLNLNWDYTEGLNIFGVTAASIGAVCAAAAAVTCFSAPGGKPQRAKRTRNYESHIDAEGEVSDIGLVPAGAHYEEDGVGEQDNVMRDDRGMADRENGEDAEGNSDVHIEGNLVDGTQELQQSQNPAVLCIQLAEFNHFQSASVLGTELPIVAAPELIAVVGDLVSDGRPILQSFMDGQSGLEAIEMEELNAAGGLEPTSPHYIPQATELQGASLNLFYDNDDEKIDTYPRASHRVISLQAFDDYAAQDYSSSYASSSALHDVTYLDPNAFDAGLMPNTPVIQLEPDMAIEMSSTANRMNHVQVTQIVETAMRAQSEALLRTVNKMSEASRAEVLNAGRADISRGAERNRQNLLKSNNQATTDYAKVCEARNKQRTIDEQAMAADNTTRFNDLWAMQRAQGARRSQSFLDSSSSPPRGARVMPELPPLVKKPFIP